MLLLILLLPTIRCRISLHILSSPHATATAIVLTRATATLNEAQVSAFRISTRCLCPVASAASALWPDFTQRYLGSATQAAFFLR
jgi:hypothetical protein